MWARVRAALGQRGRFGPRSGFAVTAGGGVPPRPRHAYGRRGGYAGRHPDEMSVYLASLRDANPFAKPYY